MTRAEKAGYKAYPENEGYSTIADVMYDYNAEKRRVFIEGYEQGYKDAVANAYDAWCKDFKFSSEDVRNIIDEENKKESLPSAKKIVEEISNKLGLKKSEEQK